MSTTYSTGGGYTSCVVDEGNVRCWGGAILSGSGSFDRTLATPSLVRMEDGETPLSGIVDLAGADSRFCAMHDNGSVFCWGGRGYAANTGATGAVTLGSGIPVYATSDAKIHVGASVGDVQCGPL